jgi:MOSC domain-containing protein YiiM
MIVLDSIFIGQPQIISDANGDWESAIYKKRVTEPIELGFGGLAGDKVADIVNHGRPGQAVCIQPISHYDYWNERYLLEQSNEKLGPGSVGENWTICGADESSINVGDVYQVGSARVRVTGPRGPCSKQERKLNLKGFLKATIETLRTGLYARVLTPGTVKPGDLLVLDSRPNSWLTVDLVNRAYFRPVDSELIARLLAAPELEDEWKDALSRKIS